MNIPTIKDIKNLKGKRVILRLDFNVPTKNGKIVETMRIDRTIPTIEYLRKKKARIIILSHIGRDPGDSIEPVAHALRKFGPVVFVSDLTGHAAQGAVAAMKDGNILLFEKFGRHWRQPYNPAPFAPDLAGAGPFSA